MMLTGTWRNTGFLAVILAVVGVVVFAALWLFGQGRAVGAPRPGEETLRGHDQRHRAGWT